MNSREVLDVLENMVAKGDLLHLSGEQRRTKAILYRTLQGRSLGLEIGNAVANIEGGVRGGFCVSLPKTPATYPDLATLVLEKKPLDGLPDWTQVSGFTGITLQINNEYKSTAYRLSGARLEEGRQQLVSIETPAGLDLLLSWYGATSTTSATTGGDVVTGETVPQLTSKPSNLILYGPPGTGKTYATAAEAVQLCDGVLSSGTGDLVRDRYNDLVRTGQIRFVTFHQSYAYEDFVEGLRPTMGEDEEASATAGFRLMPVPGVFREIAALAEQARKTALDGQPGAPIDLDGRRFWKMALGAKGSEEHIYQAAIAGGYAALGWGADVDWSDPRFTGLDAMMREWAARYPGDHTVSHTRQPWTFRNAMKVGDIVIVPYGNSAFRAIGEVTGEYRFEPSEDGTYNHRRAVRWLLALDEPLPLDTIVDGNFTMRALYEIPPHRIRKEALIRLNEGPSRTASPTRPDQFVRTPVVRAAVAFEAACQAAIC